MGIGRNVSDPIWTHIKIGMRRDRESMMKLILAMLQESYPALCTGARRRLTDPDGVKSLVQYWLEGAPRESAEKCLGVGLANTVR